MSSFAKRLLSTIILAPLVLAVLYYGGYAFLAFVFVVTVIAAFEWTRMSIKLPHKAAAVLIALAGSIYIGAALNGAFTLRMDHPVLCFTLLLAVWGSDIGGYVFGKFIGGPKMAPKISPNKTWAGLFGACFMPAVIMTSMGVFWFDGTWNVKMALCGVAVGLLGQAGDLTVSKMKRAVGVKDTGNLIPGHGGILDRIDALLLVFLVFGVLTTGGIMAWPFVQ